MLFIFSHCHCHLCRLHDDEQIVADFMSVQRALALSLLTIAVLTLFFLHFVLPTIVASSCLPFEGTYHKWIYREKIVIATQQCYIWSIFCVAQGT